MSPRKVWFHPAVLEVWINCSSSCQGTLPLFPLVSMSFLNPLSNELIRVYLLRAGKHLTKLWISLQLSSRGGVGLPPAVRPWEGNDSFQRTTSVSTAERSVSCQCGAAHWPSSQSIVCSLSHGLSQGWCKPSWYSRRVVPQVAQGLELVALLLVPHFPPQALEASRARKGQYETRAWQPPS